MTRTIRQSCQNCLLSLQWDSLMKAKFSQKVFSFCCVIGFWAVFFDIWHKIFCKVVKSAFYVFRRTLWLRKTVLKDSSWFFSNLIKNFSDFQQKRFEKECRNRFLHIHKTFRRNRFFIFFGFVTFSDFGQNFSKNLHKIFRKVVKTAFYVFRRTVWWKKRKLLKIVFFSKIEQFFSWLLAKKYSAKVTKLLCKR